VAVAADALLLALGGGSWARLGSDGAWVAPLQQAGLPVAPLQPANCGFDVGWSEHLASAMPGPLKNVVLRCTGPQGESFERKGECVLTATGLEGNLVYAAAALLREQIRARGQAELTLDLRPDRTLDELTQALARGRGASVIGQPPAGAGRGPWGTGGPAARGRDGRGMDGPQPRRGLARRAHQGLADHRAGAPAGRGHQQRRGVRWRRWTRLLARPHIAVAGEMLDWEAPTGGYLLTACLASGVVAARGAGWPPTGPRFSHPP
jgi:predicted flavoprotein YhiN